MKSIVPILTVLLSFIFGGDRTGDLCDRNLHFSDAVIQCSDKESADKEEDINDSAILPVRTAEISGDVSSICPSSRSVNSGRRIQPSSRSSFLVIKAGKVFDRNNFYAFRAVILQFQSGIHSNSRYIHSICLLLI